MAERLREMGCVAAREEACDLVDSARDLDELGEFLMRRSRGEPLAWITGWVQFCGHRLRVEPGTYVPRYQSEELARRAADALATVGGRAADLCTGVGAIASVLMRAASGAVVVGTELDPRAAACGRRNGVAVVLSDLGEALRSGVFDVVTAVAPYVPERDLPYLPPDVLKYEPLLALDGGEEGLDVLLRVVASASRLLRPGGYLFLELGAEQDRRLSTALTRAGFWSTQTWCDEDGDLRGLAARMAGR